MKKACTDMVSVLDCSVTNCVYNHDKQCCTPAITVGSVCPACDTFQKGKEKGGEMDVNGGVGACHKGDCTYNQSLECRAAGIHVGSHMMHADCETYEKRK